MGRESQILNTLMQIHQTSIKLKPYSRGFHLITKHIEKIPKEYGVRVRLLNLFLKHTSASLTINENADPSVRVDMEHYFNDIAKTKSYYTHTYEGEDDMPAHIKSSILGQSLTIPITDYRLNLGIWQGIYLGEHRDSANSREIIITLYGE